MADVTYILQLTNPDSSGLTAAQIAASGFMVRTELVSSGFVLFSDMLVSGYLRHTDLLASGYVRTLNGLKNAVTLVGSGNINIWTDGQTIQINSTATQSYYPVDARAVSGNIIPDNSGFWNLGSSTKFFHQIWANSGIYQSGVSVSGFELIYKVNGLSGPFVNFGAGIGVTSFVNQDHVIFLNIAPSGSDGYKYATIAEVANSGFATRSELTTSGYLKAADRMYPVDARAVSGSISPDTSGYYSLGSIAKNWKDIFALSGVFQSGVYVSGNQMVAKVQGVVGPNITLKNGYGLSGIDGGSTTNDVYITVSGFLTESGISYTRRRITTHDGMGAANQTYKSNGIYAINASGTTSSPDDNKRLCTHYLTGAAATAVAAVGSILTQSLRPQDNLDFMTDFRIMISGGTTTIWCGLVNLNPNVSGMENLTRDTRFQCAALFRMNGQPNWWFITKDNTSTATSGVVPTGILPLVDTNWHDIRIHTDDAGVTWTLDIDEHNGILRQTGNAPTSGSVMGPFLQIAGNAVSFRNSYMSVMSNTPNPTRFGN